MHPSLMDEMAYRWHKCSDIDGQSDIASVILPPLCQTPAPYHHPLFHLLSLSSILWILSFSVFSLYYLPQLAPLLSFLGHVCVFSDCFCLSFQFCFFLVLSVLVCRHQPAQKQTWLLRPFHRIKRLMLLCVKDILKESVLQLRKHHKHASVYLSNSTLINIGNYQLTFQL